MNKALKKVISIFCLSAIVLSSTACGKSPSGNKDNMYYPDVPYTVNNGVPSWEQGEKEDLTIDWYVDRSTFYWSGRSGSAVANKIYEKTGIKINFITPLNDDGTMLNSILNSNNMPDLITLDKNNLTRVQMQEDGFAYSLNELSRRWAPTLFDNWSNEINQVFGASDGELYGVPSLYYSFDDIAAFDDQKSTLMSLGAFIARKSYLDWYTSTYPTADPTTPDGFIEMCKKVKERFNVNYTIMTDAFTTSVDNKGLYLLAEYFAVPMENPDGSLTCLEAEEGFYDCLEFLNKCYNEGLISDSNFSNNTTQVSNIIQNGACFVFMGRPQDYGRKQIINDGVKKLVENGRSDYKILLSEDASSAEEYAASEFNLLLSEVSGIKLDIVKSADLTVSTKYVSIGDTVMAKQAGAIVEVGAWERNGFRLKSYKDGLMIVGLDKTGLIYGVYRFFEKNCNYMYYAPDEIRIDKSSTVTLKEYDYEDWPDFPERDVYNYTTNGDPATTMRYYLNGSIYSKWGDNYGEGTWWSSLNDQSMALQIVPYDKYRSNYPSWYYGKGGGSNATNPQLCFTTALYDKDKYQRGEWFDIEGNWLNTPDLSDGSRGLFWTFCYNLIKDYISVETDKSLFQIGMSDNQDFCTCANCLRDISKYTRTGVTIRFINAVADVVREWQQRFCPNRTIYLTMFAYLTVIQPPVDLVNGQYIPKDESLKVRDNVIIRYAPMTEGYLFPLLNKEENANAYFQMNGWKALANHFAVWDYTVNFGEFLQDFPSWMTMYDNLKSYYDYGYVDVYNQGCSKHTNTSFYYFDMWVRSRLLWDIHLDFDTLKQEFFDAYYGCAADYINEYMDTTAYHYLTTMKSNGYYGSSHSSTVTLSNFSYSYLKNIEKLFDSGFDTIEKDSSLSAERKEVLKTRLSYETLYYRYAELVLYQTMMSREELISNLTEFESLCKQAGVTALSNSTNVFDTISDWKIKNHIG